MARDCQGVAFYDVEQSGCLDEWLACVVVSWMAGIWGMVEWCVVGVFVLGGVWAAFA